MPISKDHRFENVLKRLDAVRWKGLRASIKPFKRLSKRKRNPFKATIRGIVFMPLFLEMLIANGMKVYATLILFWYIISTNIK